MGTRVGSQTIFLSGLPKIAETASIVGKKEGEGKLAKYFDTIIEDMYYGEKSWEKAESKFQKEAIIKVLQKAKLQNNDIDILFGGDLLNQCIGTSYSIRDINIPFVGLYGACSTMVEGLCLAAVMVDGGYANNAVALTSSHFCSSERQYRYPLEYGGQRTPTSQWTVTGSGAAVVSMQKPGPLITHVTFGKIVDMGIKNINNMGSAMAPAAVDTISAHLKDRNIDLDYYDAVATGDLGKVGHAITMEQLAAQGFKVGENCIDCGVEIYDAEAQDVHAGGSGCGCCATVFSGWLFNSLVTRKINKLLLVATGALMSPVSMQQGESIPGIAHAIAIENDYI